MGETAQNMKEKWESLEKMMDKLNDKYNVNETITSQDIATFQDARKATKQELGALKSKLLIQMAKDIRGTDK